MCGAGQLDQHVLVQQQAAIDGGGGGAEKGEGGVGEDGLLGKGLVLILVGGGWGVGMEWRMLMAFGDG